MSNHWTIHVADSRKGPNYVCSVRLELDSWVLWLYDHLNDEMFTDPEAPVRACWVDKMELRDGSHELLQIEAQWLKNIPFHEPNWHPDRIAMSLAASAFLKALPDDWPCFLYNT